MLRVVEVIPVRGRNPKLEIRNKSSHNAVCDRAQDGEQSVSAQDPKQFYTKSPWCSLPPSLFVRLLFWTIEDAHGVGDVPAEACESPAVGGSERLVTLVRCQLAHSSAACL